MSRTEHEQGDPTGDPLRERLARRDPVPADVPVDPVDGLAARALLESVMNSPLTSGHTGTDAQHGAAADDLAGRRSRRSRPLLLAAAAVVLAAGVGVGIQAVQGGDGSDVGGRPAPAPAVTLALPAADPLTAICTPFDPAALATQPVAFAGTVTTVADGKVTLKVDRWYRGGASATVELTVPPGFSAALDGVDFTLGKKYLVSANDGVVGSCGSSGEATPELTAIFDRAFA
jgi:hypothetical protein